MRKKGNYWVIHYETGKWLVAQWCAGEWSTLESNSEVYDDEFWTFIDENRIDDERPSCRVVTDITDY
jgi:hypothetical protein